MLSYYHRPTKRSFVSVEAHIKFNEILPMQFPGFQLNNPTAAFDASWGSQTAQGEVIQFVAKTNQVNM